MLVGPKDPQDPLGAQLHVTPAFAESLVTVAVMDAVPFTARDAGAPLTETLIAGGGVMVMVAVPDFVVSVTDVAVIVTLLKGTVEGAV